MRPLLARVATVVALLSFCGCGASSNPPGDSGTPDAGDSGAAVPDSAASDADVTLTCADEGLTYCSDSCDGNTEICVGSSAATGCCRALCDEMVSGDCGAGAECRTLFDAGGNPIGSAACFDVQGIGEPCSPERCPSSAACVGNDASDAVCRDSCDPAAPDDCDPGTACTMLMDGDPPGACLPAGDVGDPCAPEPCVQGTVCTGDTPETATCRQACDPSATNPGCATTESCVPFDGSTTEGACLPN